MVLFSKALRCDSYVSSVVLSSHDMVWVWMNEEVKVHLMTII